MKDKIIDEILDETLNMVVKPRRERIQLYIELYLKKVKEEK